MAKKVFIGVGHGGSDPGAVANGFKEKDLNLAIATACVEELRRHGVEVLASRTTDVNTTSTQDISACNKFNPNLAVDIHNNAGGGDGVEVYYSYNGTGNTLANNILAEVVKIGQNSRGAKTRRGSSGKDYYYFIREISAPSVIVECAFLDNKKDVQIIDTAAEQKAMGIAIAKGILATLGIAWKAETTATNTATNTAAASVKATDPARAFLKSLAGTYKVTANSGLNVRHGAGITKKKMVAIPKGTAVQCYGYYTSVLGVKWLYIQFTYKNVTYTGFASSAYLKK